MDLKFKKESFHENKIPFGRDSTPNIPPVEFDGKKAVERFNRKKNRVKSKKESLKPFLLLEATVNMEGGQVT